MATIDSGTETLFSDESSCELVCSPSVCSGDEAEAQDCAPRSINSRLAPPNIQPYSGVLEQGKMVIRPIAFKPTAMTPTTRFGVAGERYSSTPILTRPGSRLTLYGSSNDLHQSQANSMVNNYSLERKLRSSCPSTSSSPRLAMSSLTSLPHCRKLINYDSLESVRKSPVSNTDSSNLHKTSFRLISNSNAGSLLDLTPSPSDSGVSELEAALRDRDSELAYLRQTMEHNEQVIFRVYQEKEKAWERELKRLKCVQESRLKAGAQKVQKLEQMLMMQTYQLQQEKRRLLGDVQKVNAENERLRQEVGALRSRLEETEWALCQKTGELSLMKTQIKESQNDHTNKCQELLQTRTDYRELKEKLEEKNKEVDRLMQLSASYNKELENLKEDLARIKSTPEQTYSSISIDEKAYEDVSETEKLKAEIRELREELSDMSLNDYSGVEPGRAQKIQQLSDEESLEDLEVQKYNENNIRASNEAERLKKELDVKTKQFQNEKLVWAQEKEKVLRYQRQLQTNYVQMFRRTRALEAEIESLTIELELDKTGVKKSLDLSQTIEL